MLRSNSSQVCESVNFSLSPRSNMRTSKGSRKSHQYPSLRSFQMLCRQLLVRAIRRRIPTDPRSCHANRLQRRRRFLRYLRHLRHAPGVCQKSLSV